jgi:hypothetical protein
MLRLITQRNVDRIIMTRRFRNILRAPPELLSDLLPLMVVMLAVIIVGLVWLLRRKRKLRPERRHYATKKPRKRSGK